MTTDTHTQALEALRLGLGAAEETLAERQQALAGYPHKWRAEQERVNTIRAALAAAEAQPVKADLSGLARAAGMVCLLDQGAASCVHSEGCNGVTQEHLQRFADLVRSGANPAKAERVHAIVNAGHFPGMSEAFDAHMGAACWTDPAYAPDASMWAAAWKASYQRAADGFRAQAARDTADLRMQFKAASNEPLTLDQIAALEAGCGHQSVDWDARVSLVRAAEAAHGIGSKA